MKIPSQPGLCPSLLSVLPARHTNVHESNCHGKGKSLVCLGWCISCVSEFQKHFTPIPKGLWLLGSFENISLMETSSTKCPLVFADVNQDDLFTLFKGIFLRTRHSAHDREIVREDAKRRWKEAQSTPLSGTVFLKTCL